mmetsp:Transcript_29955/g.91907  ORF Transcript_29955/g.91907 Transcript_29955/m.91907 type:complete len:237 (-) Transcript_29955:630-1340(-)
MTCNSLKTSAVAGGHYRRLSTCALGRTADPRSSRHLRRKGTHHLPSLQLPPRATTFPRSSVQLRPGSPLRSAAQCRPRKMRTCPMSHRLLVPRTTHRPRPHCVCLHPTLRAKAASSQAVRHHATPAPSGQTSVTRRRLQRGHSALPHLKGSRSLPTRVHCLRRGRRRPRRATGENTTTARRLENARGRSMRHTDLLRRPQLQPVHGRVHCRDPPRLSRCGRNSSQRLNRSHTGSTG